MKPTIEKLLFSPKQKEFLLSPFDHTFEVNEGAIRSGKSAVACMRLALFYLLSKDEQHLVSGYNQEIAYNLSLIHI